MSDHQRMYVETVRRFVKTEILPRILELEGKHAFPGEIIRKAWETGILNLSIPGAIKGYEMDAVSAALIIEELAYGDSGIATSAMCNDLANSVIAQHGSGPQQEAFLRPFVDNPLLASFCLTEPGAGSDNSAMTTFMSCREDGTYLLNGAKCFITNASYAAQFTVFCKVGKPTGNFMACVIVPVPAPSPEELAFGFEQGRKIAMSTGGNIVVGKGEDKLGQRLSNAAAVTFEDVVIAPEQIIGDRRLGFRYVIDVLDYARPMVAAIGVGLARRALDVTLNYTRERKQFGQRICDLPVARDTLTTMWKKVELAKLALMKSACALDEKTEDHGLYASLAKNTAAEAALFCANEGLHLHGGYRFMKEYEIYEGTREVEDMIIGREIC